MQKMSVVIITLNEEENIGKCLESVAWADEVIVSDSGSTDSTVNICEQYGVRVFYDEWVGFGRQKNLCVDRTVNDWVLNIDADERITPALKGEMEAALVSGGRKNGYYIPRKNFFLGRWVKRCGWYPDYNLRLFKKDEGRFNEREVHESVTLSNPITGRFTNPLEHYTYKNIRDYVKRMNTYSGLAASEMYKNGRKACFSDLFFRPFFTFFKMYFIKMGILEGVTGMVLSGLYSCYTFLKYAKLWEMRER